MQSARRKAFRRGRSGAPAAPLTRRRHRAGRRAPANIFCRGFGSVRKSTEGLMQRALIGSLAILTACAGSTIDGLGGGGSGGSGTGGVSPAGSSGSGGSGGGTGGAGA